MAELSIAEAIRRERRRDVPIEGTEFVLVVEIPTDMKFFRLLEAHQKVSDVVLNGELVKACTVGWKGFLNSDLMSSGTEDPAPYDPEAFAAWVDDQSELWPVVGNAIMSARAERKGKREDDAKN